MKKILYFAMLFAMPAMAQQTTVSTLEDTSVEFSEQGYWNGGKIGNPVEGDWGEQTYYCTWKSGLLTGHVDYSFMEDYGYSYDWWGGIALSQRTSTELTSLDDQYNNIVGTGANGSKTFAVVYGTGTIDINVEGGALVNSLKVVNSSYAMQNILVGDGYSPKFQNDGDHLHLLITAHKADGTDVTKTVVLAEFTTELSYINDWTKVSLSDCGTDVTQLEFALTAHNTGVPLYACIDDIEVVTGAEGPASFENLELADESFWNGTDDSGSFISGGFKFENGHQVYDYGEYGVFNYCYGFFYTNRTATTYYGDAENEQYNSAVGHGADDSSNYATYNLNLYDDPKGIDVLGDEQVISGCYLTNNAYAYLSMKNGENNTKQFQKGDWFKLTITGLNAEGEQTGTVDLYLADLRSENEDEHFILDEWRWCDLTPLGAVKRLEFNMSSTDNGEWGMNTPAYFCLDNLGDEAPDDDVTAISQVVNRKSENRKCFDLQGRQLSNRPIQKGLYIVNGKKLLMK